MGGTILCGVTDTPEGRGAAQLAGALAERLGSRLVLAHAVDGAPPGADERYAAVAMVLTEIATVLPPREIELRVQYGDRAELLAQIAAEEGADLIVLGSRARGLRGRQLGCTLARQLEAATPAPVLVAPPQTRKRAERRLTLAADAASRKNSPEEMVDRFLRLPLLWQVFAINAALLVVGTLLLALTPVTIHAPIALVEVVVLVLGLGLMVAANLALLRRAFAPLERLVVRTRTVDLLRPGQRLAASGSVEVVELVRAFNEMLDRLERERRESGGRALAAQEAERLRVAGELHDEVGQVLTGVLLQLDAHPELAETRQAVRQALEEIRRIAQELRPAMLEHLGLVSALTELSGGFAERSGVRVERRFAAALPPLSPDAELAIYRVAQESLTNVARHAGASRVELTLEPGADSVVLHVVDDGRGFDEATAPEGHGGLRGMRERAVLVGGVLAIKSARGGGVDVRLEVPAAA